MYKLFKKSCLMQFFFSKIFSRKILAKKKTNHSLSIALREWFVFKESMKLRIPQKIRSDSASLPAFANEN